MRRSAQLLDWENRPHPFKEYLGLEARPLYPVELYLACAELEGLQAGVYHFHPRELALRQLRRGDARGALAEAAAAPELTEAAAVLVLTEIHWRSVRFKVQQCATEFSHPTGQGPL